MTAEAALASVAGVAIVVTLGLLVAYFHVRRLVSAGPTSKQQLQALQRHTAEWSIPYNELTFGRQIGKGSQGQVYRAEWRGTVVAVKKVDMTAVEPDIVEEFCQEAAIMRRLRHPCLTLFMGVSVEHPNLALVSEIVERGSLFDLLHDESAPLTWSRRLHMALDVARGMHYLHSMTPSIIHRDLKSLNILVDKTWRAKVADFGMTRFMQEGTMTQCGSPLWMAPEMIRNQPYDGKADVYSFGIVLHELYTCKIPYRSERLKPSQLVVKVVREDLRPVIPLRCPQPYAHLMENCWHRNPKRRPTFERIIEVLESFIADENIITHQPMSEKKKLTVARPVVAGGDARGDAGAGAGAAAPGAAAANGGGAGGGARQSTSALQAIAPSPRGGAARSSNSFIGVSAGGVNGASSASPAVEMTTLPGAVPMTTSASASLAPPSAAEASPNATSWRMNAERDLRLEERVGPREHKGVYRAKTVRVGEWKLMPHTDAGKVAEHLHQVSHLRHPNLSLFMGAYFDGPDELRIVTEFLERGDLHALVHDVNVVFEWDTALQFLIDVGHGLAFLHGHEPPIAHPDVCSHRLLVDQNWRVKLGDYAVGVGSGVDVGLKPSPWMAPEVLRAFAVDGAGGVRGGDAALLATTPAANVYSFGMLAYQVLQRVDPLEDLARLVPHDGGAALIAAVTRAKDGERPTLPESMSEDFRVLLQACWAAAPRERPPIAEIIEVLQAIKQQGPARLVLTTENARRYHKARTVFAYRSKDAMTIIKDWGRNQCKAGCYVLLSGEDDVYLCTPEVFARTYEPLGVPGRDNEYRKVGTILARRMPHAFALKTESGTEHGAAGDYLVQNEQGDQWVIEEHAFSELYEESSGSGARAAGASAGPSSSIATSLVPRASDAAAGRAIMETGGADALV